MSLKSLPVKDFFIRKEPLLVLLTAFLLYVCLFAASCAVNPVSGERELMLLSESEEINLGRQTDKEIAEQYGVYEEEELSGYISALGDQLAKVSHRPDLSYRFRILDSPVVNAFAVPGGYVYLTRGILAYMNDEAELAGIMGHEIGHITARHSARQYSRAQLAQIGLGLGSVLSETFRNFAGVAQLGVGMLFLRFSRDNERQADDLGVEYSSKTGYDSSRMAYFFETIERLNPGESASGLPGWFSTHPNPADRQGAIKKKSEEWQQTLGLKSPKVDRNAYLKKIDGLVFDEDPRQGYVKDNVFYHPELLFQFPVPQGWKVMNTPSAVSMLSPDKDAAVQFGLSKGTSIEGEVRTFVEKSGAVVLTSENRRVNDFPAYRVISRIKTREGLLQVISYFIQKEKRIYVFHGYSYQSRFSHYLQSFIDTMEGFNKPADTKSLRKRPDRIRIRYTGTERTLRRALQNLGVEDGELEKTAILNGKHLDDILPKKTPLKIVVKGDR